MCSSDLGIRVEIVRNDAAGYLRSVYTDHNFDLASGWHQYRSDPAVSTTVWYRSGSPKGAPWTNQWGWSDPALDKTIDDAATEIDPAKRKALYAEFQKQVTADVPLVWITELPYHTIHSKRVRNVPVTIWGTASPMLDVWLAD